MPRILCCGELTRLILRLINGNTILSTSKFQREIQDRVCAYDGYLGEVFLLY